MLIADQIAAAIVQTVGVEAEAVDAGNFTFLVSQVTQGGDAQHAFAVDHAVLVIEVTQVRNAQRAFAADHPALVVEVLRGGAQIDGGAGGAHQCAVLVVQAGAVEGQLLRGADAALVVVVEQAIDGHRDIAVTEQYAAIAVVETGRANLQRCCRDRALDRGQRLVEGQAQLMIAQQLTAAVVQRFGDQVKGQFTGNLAATVVHLGKIFQQQLPRRIDHPALVVQRAAMQVDADAGVAAEQLAALLIEALNICAQRIAGAEAAGRVGHFAGAHFKLVGGVNARLTVIEFAGGDVQIAFAADHAFLLVVQRAAGERQRSIGEQLAATVADRTACVDAERFGAGQRTAIVIETLRIDGQSTFAEQIALRVAQIARESNGEVLLRGQASAVYQTVAEQRQPGSAGQHAVVAVDHLVDGQCQIAARQHVAAVAVVEPGADQAHTGLARQFTAAVIDMVDDQLQRLGRTDQALAAVIQTRRRERQALVGDDHASLVVEQTGDGEIDLATPANLTPAVVEGGTARLEASGGDLAFYVAQRTVDDQGEFFIAEQLAAVVVQALCAEIPGFGSGDFTGAVVHILEVFQQQLARRMNTAALVVEQAIVHVQRQVCVAEQLAAVLLQRGDGSLQGFLAADDAAGVIQVHGGQQQRAVRGETAALAVFELTGGQGRIGLGTEDAVVAVIETAAGEGQALLRGDQPALILYPGDAGQCHRFQARQLAQAIVEAAEIQGHLPFTADQALLVVEGIVEGQVQCVLADDPTAHIAQTDAAERRRAFAENQAIGGVDDLRDFQAQRGVGQHLAALAVIQACAIDMQVELAGKRTGAVVDLVDIDGQGLERPDQAVLAAVESLAGEFQIAFGNQFAGLLSQVVDAGVDIALAGNPSGIVGDIPGFEAQQSGRGQQAAIAVVQRAAFEGQRCLALGAALVAVIQIIDQQRRRFVGAQNTRTVVGGGAADGQGVETGNLAGAVIQARGLHVHRTVGLDQALVLVVQLVADARGQHAFAGQLALLAVVQLLRFYRHGLFRADPSGAIVDGAEGGDVEQTASGDQAGDVVQRGDREHYVALAAKFTVAVDQLTDVAGESAIAGERALIVQHLIGSEGQAVVAQHFAGVAVVQRAGGDARGLAAEQTILVVEGLRGVDGQVAAGAEALATVVQILCAKAQITIAVTAAVSIDAGFDGAGVGQLSASAEHHAVTGGEGLAVGQIALGLHVERRACIDRSLRVEAGRFDVDRAGSRGVGQAQLPVGIKLNIAAAGDQFTVEFHPDAGLGADQFDRSGVHAAECRGVDGQLRFGAAVVGAGSGVEGVGVDVVATGDDGQVLCLDLRIDLGAAGDDFEAVDIGCVDARAFDSHAALIDLKAIQSTVFHHRFTGGQRHPWCVDKTAAVAGDAIRVGHDDPRRLPGHFGVTAQLTRVAADDFVENRLRRTAVFQVRVADDVTAQLRVRSLSRAVVEDDALCADVVIVELVVRQATGVGRGDVDDRHAVAGTVQRGIRVGNDDAVGLRPDRLPEHDVGQQERQSALGHAEELLAFGRSGRRLASEECVLANVHVEDPATGNNRSDQVPCSAGKRRG